MEFPVRFADILDRISNVDPVAYSRTRNYADGHVSYLSPYLSRGMVSTTFVYERLRQDHKADDCKKFLSELLWREYFQRLQQDNPHIDSEPAHPEGNTLAAIPSALFRAATGIAAVDKAILALYETGHMHNHIRMYTASMCAMAEYRYYQPASWMYYHLLDGDIASNFCSWQWVAGLQTGLRYTASQDNINRFCGTAQKGTFLDRSHAELQQLSGSHPLSEPTQVRFSTLLPPKAPLQIDSRPVLLYNSYNLDPMWHSAMDANRVLLLDPQHFEAYPVSEKVMSFILAAAGNIPGITVFSGSYRELLEAFPDNNYITKEHPLFRYPGAAVEPREWLSGDVDGAFGSFSKFYKTVIQTYHGKYT